MLHIHYISQLVYSLHVLACNSDTDLKLSLTQQQLAAVFGLGRSICKCSVRIGSNYLTIFMMSMHG